MKLRGDESKEKADVPCPVDNERKGIVLRGISAKVSQVELDERRRKLQGQIKIACLK